MTPGMTKTYTAGAAISKRRIVKFSADRTVVQAADDVDFMVGVSDQSADVASGARVDVRRTGIAEIDAGGVIARGDFVTSDASGKAVACAPAAGETARYIGIAEVTAASGDIIDVFLSPGQVTTPAEPE